MSSDRVNYLILQTPIPKILFFGGLLGYSFFSFFLVDPNLVLSSQPEYWSWQNSLWQWAAVNRLGLAIFYAGLILAIFVGYLGLLRHLVERGGVKQVWRWLLLAIACLMIAYPALSHDVFNYMFNAKMVWWYGANPHVQVALDFPGDPWLWFMHNTHTVAPYGYGWTAISLLPAIIGQNQLKLTLLLFRLLMVLALVALFWVEKKLLTNDFDDSVNQRPLSKLVRRINAWMDRLTFKKQSNSAWKLGLFFLNPLVLIETVGNIHNDVVMMLLAMFAVYCCWRWRKGRQAFWLVIGLTAFGLSVSVKFATIVMLIAGGIYWWLRRKGVKIGLAEIMGLALFVPLLTQRSQRFLPWYLLWPLSWVPLMKARFFQEIMLVFSFSAMLAYLPFLCAGAYTEAVLWQRFLITFGLPAVYAGIRLGSNKFKIAYED